MHVAVGERLLELSRATGARSTVVVGTGKNVGKTVTMRAIYDAAVARALDVGLTSIGRDGEAVDAGDARSKPRIFLRSGTFVATARDVLPIAPASEIVETSRLATAAGPLVYARVRADAYYELVGPPTASGLREAVDGLLAIAQVVLVDGAVDRIAALAGGSDAVVVACGASASATMEEAVEDVRALVARLCVRRFDVRKPYVRLEGALTASRAAAFIAAKETRQIVVTDPTQILVTGRAATGALARLRVRCERELRVVAATVAPLGPTSAFEPRLFARAVAEATSLPVFDVYASEEAA